MTQCFAAPAFRLGLTGLLLALLGGCGTLLPPPKPQPLLYAFDNVKNTAPATPAPLTAPTLIINPPRAASGFDSRRIIYVREPYQLEYYAQSEWVDTPARMLAPLIVSAVENSASFRAVVLTPSAAAAELRLDTEIIRLQHELGSQPGRVRFTLRAYLVDNTTRQILARREFDQTVTATSETPYGGVIAANLAVRGGLEELAIFCREIGENWRSTAATPGKPNEEKLRAR